MKIGDRTIEISNRDKVLFPSDGLTKGDLIDYYLSVADVMIPHLERYGVTMHRFPDGLDGEDFVQKSATNFPDWIRTVTIPRRRGGSFPAPIVDSRATLVYLANQAVITLHPYLSRADDLEHPDKMIFDLDPPEDSEDYDAARQGALRTREVLADLEFMAWVQTTGSKGFHVVVPLDRALAFDDVRQFAHDVALLLVRRHPDRFTVQQRKEHRRGRVFVDTLRNAYGATAAAPYTVRALPGAPVATPIEWDELEAGVEPRSWDISSVPNRMAQRDDPWASMMRHARSLAGRRKRLDEMLSEQDPAEEEGSG
jgi:bifunctional non-homologous end joining protein LigD